MVVLSSPSATLLLRSLRVSETRPSFTISGCLVSKCLVKDALCNLVPQTLHRNDADILTKLEDALSRDERCTREDRSRVATGDSRAINGNQLLRSHAVLLAARSCKLEHQLLSKHLELVPPRHRQSWHRSAQPSEIGVDVILAFPAEMLLHLGTAVNPCGQTHKGNGIGACARL